MTKTQKIGLIIAAILFVPFLASAAFFTKAFNPITISTSLTVPVISLPAATSTGSVASSTIQFEITAVDAYGVQTNVSNQLSTTTLSNAGFNLTWSPVAGATGYNVYFSTSTPATFLQYFPATTSNAYDFTSTSSPTYVAGPPAVNNANVVNLTSSGSSVIYGGNGTATTTAAASTTALTVNGNFVAQSPATTTACYSGTAGQIFYNTSNSHLWGCNGSAWQKIF